jgi:23S rRNA (cytidine1920-2'-O)/16S rRNA (cytidine1409-2'-O)-methyltransferase
MKDNRLDVIVAIQFDLSRSSALDHIKQGHILVNGIPLKKPSYIVKEYDVIEISEFEHYVSRGGFKLCGAIKDTNVSIEDRVCLDVGASTGGFTDCLLSFGASSVVTIDVGSNQLHPRIQENEKVKWYENTNINDVKVSDFPDGFDIIVVDVSFTSLNHVFLALHRLLKKQGSMFLLFKPQFEVGKEYLNKKGIVKQQDIIDERLSYYVSYFKTFNYPIINVFPSRLKGKQGNQEYFIYLSR